MREYANKVALIIVNQVQYLAVRSSVAIGKKILVRKGYRSKNCN